MRQLQVRGIRLDPDVVDVAVAALTCAIAIGTSLAVYQDPANTGLRPLDPVGVALLLAQTLPLAVRRRNPPRVLAITGVSITLYAVLGYGGGGGGLAVLLAFYTVAAHTPRRIAAPMAAATSVGLGITVLSFAANDRIAADTVLSNYIIFVTAWIFGDWIRVRREYTAELEARALMLEREQQEQANAAVAEERARIARELHDVVAHSVSVMVVQSAAARRVLDVDPAAAKEALASVEASGRSALTEMRRMLGVLRSESREEALEPQPGIGQLEQLVGQMGAAGLSVTLSVHGERRQLSRGVDLAVYRIVQEALTNTLKHAGMARAWVEIAYGDDDLDIEVRDDGRGAAAGLKSTGSGQGLIGMRERVGLYGGTLEVGPTMWGGWHVRARLPLDEPDRTARPAPPVRPDVAVAAGEPWASHHSELRRRASAAAQGRRKRGAGEGAES